MNTISNHRFYRTFTPFITPQTKTAEKTLHGKEYSVYKPPSNLLQKFYSYISAGGFLLIPITSLLVSKKNLYDMMHNATKEIFRGVNNENPTFLNNIGIKLSKLKNAFAQRTLKFLQPIETRQELLANKLSNANNRTWLGQTYQKITNFFLKNKRNAHMRNVANLHKKFANLESIVLKQADIIEQSAHGKLKIAFPSNLLKDPANELPQAIDLSKTANGKNRASEIKRILGQIKQILKEKPTEFQSTGKKLSYSCEEVFKLAEDRLTQINKALRLQSQSTNKTQELLKDIYINLTKYRYAENFENGKHALPKDVRQFYLKKMQNSFEELKKSIKHPEKMNLQLIELENLLFKNNNASTMGLLEELRQLLKCNDIKYPLIKDGINPALFKQFKTEEYIKTKRLITDLAQEIKFAQKTEAQFLPQALATIKKGHPIIDAVSVGVPTACLTADYISSGKKKEKRNLVSFLLGSLTMMGSHYLTMCSIPTAIINGLATAFITSKLFNKFSKEK